MSPFIPNAIDGRFPHNEIAKQTSKVSTSTAGHRRAPSAEGMLRLIPKSDHSASSDASTGILEHISFFV